MELKHFSSIEQITTDVVFINFVEAEINGLRTRRLSRPEPPKGCRYKRDWYDQMISKDSFSAAFFLKNIPDIWNRKSNLSSLFRRIIEQTCGVALAKTMEFYDSKEDIKVI